LTMGLILLMRNLSILKQGNPKDHLKAANVKRSKPNVFNRSKNHPTGVLEGQVLSLYVN